MKKRKLIFLLPIAAMALGACGNKDEDKSSEEPGQQEQQDEVTLAIKNKANFELEVEATKQLEAELKGTTGTLVWASSAEGVATVDQTGKVTAVAVGTATISVTFGDHADSVTVTVKEKQSQGTNYGTVDSPITVAEAKAIIDDECAENDALSKEAIVVKGFVKSIIREYSYTEGPSIEFDLSDGTNDIYVYRCLATEEAKANLEVGSEVVVKAFAKNYKGTKEMCDNGDTKSSFVSIKASTKVMTSLESVSAPTEVTKDASILLSSVSVVVVFDDGFKGSVHPDSIDLDSSVAGETTATVHVGDLTKEFTVTIVGQKENKFVEAYEAAIAVGKGNVTAEEYYFEGVVVGKRATEYFIQFEGYGIDVYNPSITPAIGDKLGVTATLKNYNNLVETGTISKIEKLGTETLPEAAEITSVAAYDDLKQNILCEVEGTVATKPAYQEGKDLSLSLTLGDGALTVFIKKNIVATYKDFIESLEAGDTVKLSNGITSVYNTSKQVLVIDGSSLEKVAHSVTGVSLDKTELSMEAGGAPVTLVATVTPDNATNKNVTWSSSNPEVASVEGGVVTPLAAGDTVITVTTEDGAKTSTCGVTVTAATKTLTEVVVAGPTKTTYTEGEALDLSGLVVTAHYSDESSDVITAGYTTNIENGAILTLDDTSLVVTYNGMSATAITLTVTEAQRQALPYTVQPSGGAFTGWTGEGYSAFSTNYVKLGAVGNYVKAEKLFDSRTSVRVILDNYLNGTGKEDSEIKVHALNDAGETVDYKTFAPAQISASQGDAIPQAGVTGRQVLTLQGTGITGVKIELTVRTANVVLTKIQITEPPVMVNSVSLDKTEMSLEYPGPNGELTATVLPENAELKDVDWTVSEGSSVTVSNGVVTPVAVGQATVTATAKDGSGKSASCVVTVSESSKVLESIAVTKNPDKTAYESGEVFDPTGMVVTATYEGGITEPITDYTFSTDKLVAGATSISISYGGKSTTVAITVAAAKGSTVDNPYTIDEVLAASASLADKEWLAEKVYVVGEIKGYAASASNKYTLKDADGTEFLVYKSALPEGDRACIGDTAVFYGWVENFGGTIEMTSYNDSVHTDLPTTAAILTRGTSTISLDSSSSENATVTFEATATNASEYTFTVEAKEGYQVSSVKFGGNVVEGNDGTYTVKVMANAKILVETTEQGSAVPVTLSKTTSELVTANGWSVSSGNDCNGCYTSFNLDSNISVSTSGSPNCGSIWGTSPNNDWRLYQGNGGDVTITAAEGYKIVSIKLTYGTKNNGVLMNGATQVSSGTLVSVDGSSITLTVGNTADKKNGQAQIKSWEVIYIAIK